MLKTTYLGLYVIVTMHMYTINMEMCVYACQAKTHIVQNEKHEFYTMNLFQSENMFNEKQNATFIA